MIELKRLFCQSCGAELEYHKGQKVVTCEYCGIKNIIYDDNEYEITINENNVADVIRAKTEEMEMEYRQKRASEWDRYEMNRYCYNEKREKAAKIAILIWGSLSGLFLLLGIIGAVFDIKILLLSLIVSAVLLGIGISVLFFRDNGKAVLIILGAVILISIFVLIQYKHEKRSDMEIPEMDEGFTELEIEDPELEAYELKKLLSEIGEFATSEYEYSGYAKIEEYRQIGDWNIPFTSHEIDIHYGGVIKVGYDVGAIDIEVDKKKIIVSLPEPRILDNYITALKTDEDNNLFNPIDSNEVNEKMEEVKEAELERAEKNGVYEKAKTSVKAIIIQLFSQFEGYSVTFR